MKNIKTFEPHPFAEYVRILGRGKKASSSLTQEQAYEAMAMILSNQVEPEQLGAFLMLMRIKEETGEEVAGFVQAANATFSLPSDFPEVHIDWSSYAGKKRRLPWYMLSCLLLAENGIRVFMHGSSGHTINRIYTEDLLDLFSIEPADSFSQAAVDLQQTNFTYVPLAVISPKLQQLIDLRPLFALRSCIHTIARLLNPTQCPYIMQGIFHPGYIDIHRDAALALQQPNMTLLRGDGGEIERNPDNPCAVTRIESDNAFVDEWPALFERRHITDSELNTQTLLDVWRGEQHEYGEAAVISTLALALNLIGRANTPEMATTLARKLWTNRDKSRY